MRCGWKNRAITSYVDFDCSNKICDDNKKRERWGWESCRKAVACSIMHRARSVYAHFQVGKPMYSPSRSVRVLPLRRSQASYSSGSLPPLTDYFHHLHLLHSSLMGNSGRSGRCTDTTTSAPRPIQSPIDRATLERDVVSRAIRFSLSPSFLFSFSHSPIPSESHLQREGVGRCWSRTSPPVHLFRRQRPSRILAIIVYPIYFPGICVCIGRRESYSGCDDTEHWSMDNANAN